VLIVDDDAVMRLLMRTILEADGFAVVEAANGREALQQVGVRRPGAILLDLLMPEMDGFEFISVLRAMPEERDIPVIVVTAKELTPRDHEQLNGSMVRILEKGGAGRDTLLEDLRSWLHASVHSREKVAP